MTGGELDARIDAASMPAPTPVSKRLNRLWGRKGRKAVVFPAGYNAVRSRRTSQPWIMSDFAI
jgi:hypothetical protein